MIYRCKDGSLWEMSEQQLDGTVTAYPQGGGFRYNFPVEVWEADFTPVLGNLPFGPWRKGITGFDEGPEIPCYLNDEKWNGWAMPAFTKDVAMTLFEDHDGLSFWFDPQRDEFVLRLADTPEEDPSDHYKGFDIEVEGETIHVYSIGSGYFTWNNYD